MHVCVCLFVCLLLYTAKEILVEGKALNEANERLPLEKKTEDVLEREWELNQENIKMHAMQLNRKVF